MSSLNNRRKQTLKSIGDYQVSQHAMLRLQGRLIRDSELLYTLDGPESVGYDTHSDRTIVYNNVTGISVVIDNTTGIIVTVTETDERRQKTRLRKKLALETGAMRRRPHLPPPMCA